MTPLLPRAIAVLGLIVASSLGSAACAAPSDAEDESDGTKDALIGGQAAARSRFPATVYIKGECTAAKVGPKRLLTAAHCVLDPATVSLRYKPGSKISITREPAKGYRDVEVAAVHAHPKWVKACEDTFCAASAITSRIDAPDVAIIELVNELDDVPVAFVDAAPLAIGDTVTVVGFGCTVGVITADERDNASLKFADTRLIPANRAVHEGSAVLTTDLPQVEGIYSLTAGPAAVPKGAGLCPGDSGGPLYKNRNGNLVVVGVNSNYTLGPDTKDQVGLPITNWHTRLDIKSKHAVGDWLRSVGVPTL